MTSRKRVDQRFCDRIPQQPPIPQTTTLPSLRPFATASQLDTSVFPKREEVAAPFNFSDITVVNSELALSSDFAVDQATTIQRDIDPKDITGGQTHINPQDIKLEQIGHGLVYHDQLKPSEHEWLQEEGFHPWWHPSGNVTNAGNGLNYGLLVPNDQGKAAGKVPVLAFRGTSDLATAWQDLDINSPGHGGIQPFLKDFSVIANLVMKYGYNKVDVTGHSLGGALAQHFTGTNPGIVRRLVTFQSAAPNGAQYSDNMESLDEEERPEIVHHIAKGDVVDLAGGEHLEGTFFEHDLETSGLSSVSTLARIKQAHTAKLLNTEDIIGDETLANGEQGKGNHRQDIKEYQGKRPYGVKSRLAEAGRMTALNKVTGVPMGLGVGLAGMALSVPEIAIRGGIKGVVSGGKAIAKGASSLMKTVRNTFSNKEKPEED